MPWREPDGGRDFAIIISSINVIPVLSSFSRQAPCNTHSTLNWILTVLQRRTCTGVKHGGLFLFAHLLVLYCLISWIWCVRLFACLSFMQFNVLPLIPLDSIQWALMRELPLSYQHEGGFACHLLKDHLRDGGGHRLFSFIYTRLLCLLETCLMRTERRGCV